ncbi:restriction endonuclease subunit S [Nostoc sp.]
MARKSQYPPSVKPGIPKKPHLPEGWYFKSFDDVVEVVERPAQLQDNKEYQLVTAKRSRGGIVPREKLLGEQILTKTQYYTNAGDFLISRRQIIHGACSIVPPELDGAVVSNEYSTLITKPDLLVEYLAYFSHTTYFQQTCFQSSVGVDVEKMIFKLDDWLKYKIPLPPFSEQKKIAEILSSVDEAIASTQAVIDQTRKVKQGLLQQLLTRGIGNTRFKESVIGKIPADWYIKTAQDVCFLISVGIVVKPSQYYVQSGIPCFRSANVQEGYIKDEHWVYISEESNKILSKSQLRAGDVLIVRSGYPGTSCVVTEKFDKANCIDIIFARPNIDLILSEYLSCFINSPLGKKQVLQGQGGLAQQHFNVSALNSMKISVPPIKEQEKIIEILSRYQEQILQSEIELNTLQKIKRGLMQDLLTGRVRVGVTP